MSPAKKPKIRITGKTGMPFIGKGGVLSQKEAVTGTVADLKQVGIPLSEQERLKKGEIKVAGRRSYVISKDGSNPYQRRRTSSSGESPTGKERRSEKRRSTDK